MESEGGGEDLASLLESTFTLSRGLETLYSEHEVLLEALGEEDRESETGRRDGGARHGNQDFDLEEFGVQMKVEKTAALSHSMDQLKAGIEEAKLHVEPSKDEPPNMLMHMLAQYVHTLEGDRRMLRAQVKRLASENNWLRKELGEHQQLLQETEIQLARSKEEREQLEFTTRNQKGGRLTREQSPSMVIDVQEEEAEGVHTHSSASLVGGASSGGEGGKAEYEVPENIKTLHHLALQYVNQGKPEIAVPFCKKAVHELKQRKGSGDPDVAAMLNILAVIYREQGKMKEAIKCLQETLDIREKHFGSGHPAVAATYNNLSVLHGKIGDFKTAEPYCKKALEIRQKLLGPTHPDVAKQFSNLAILCQHLGKYDEVEYYYQRALEIYQTELGPDDPNIAKTMSYLANCYLKQGKYRAAEATYRKVLDTVETRESPGNSDSAPSAVHSAAWVLNASTDSNPIPKRGEVMTPSTPGGGGGWFRSTPVHSPTVFSTLRNLSTVYREQGQVDKADELERLTKQKSLDRSQQDRVFQLLSAAEAELSVDSSNTSTPASRSPQGFRAKRPTLSQSVRRLFRFKVDSDDTASQDGSTL